MEPSDIKHLMSARLELNPLIDTIRLGDNKIGCKPFVRNTIVLCFSRSTK